MTLRAAGGTVQAAQGRRYSGVGPRVGWEGVNWVVLCLLVVLIMLFGGASRADSPAQVIVRILSIVGCLFWGSQIGMRQLRSVRFPLFLFAAAAMLGLLQLIPLPPGLWTALPGRQIFAEGYRMAGIEPGWHGLSLTPDATINSILALLPGLALLLGVAMVDRRRWPSLVLLLIAIVAVDVVLAVIQVSTGSLYLYQITNVGSAVGLFANRNHQALLLACCFPLLACWTSRGDAVIRPYVTRAWLGLAMGGLLLPLLLLTGSRGGLVFGAAGILLALLVVRNDRKSHPSGRSRSTRSLLYVALLIACALVAVTIWASRDQSLQRLLSDDGQPEIRTVYFPTYLQMARDFFPWGAGFGSFQPAFEIYEPSALMDSRYLNHAHNDLAEIAIEGGLPALLLALIAAGWFLAAARHIWLGRQAGPRVVAAAGSIIVAILMTGSLFDYPLRTPAMSALFAIALAWMTPDTRRMDQENGGEGGLAEPWPYVRARGRRDHRRERRAENGHT